MGTTESSEKFDKLKDMKKIEDRGNCSIWEKDDKLYEYYLFTDSNYDFKVEQDIAKGIDKQQFEGIVSIMSIQYVPIDKWYAKINCLHVLSDHPKYTLNEYLKKVQPKLENQQIIDLVLNVAGAQTMLGVKAQLIGLNNIYTSDGKTWKLKPFEENQSFYAIYKENRTKLGISFEMPGFPAPEEFKNSVVDRDRASIFGFGMLVLQLIGKQKSQDLYSKDGIDEQLLQQRINFLQQQKTKFTGVFIEIVIDMLDTDLTRRPNYSLLVRKLRAPTSKISTINVPKFNIIDEIPVENKDLVNLFKSSSNLKPQEINIISAVSQIDDKINHGLSTVKSKFLASTTKKKINELDGTTYEGELVSGKYEGEGTQQIYLGKLTRKTGKVLFEGTFKNGVFEFGVYYFENPQQLHTNYSYENCKSIFKYALKYEGRFKNNKRHGDGRLILTNGEIFCGDFKDDQIDGYGAYFRMDKSHVCGQWVQGVMHSTPGFGIQSSFPTPPPQMPSIHIFEFSKKLYPVQPPSDLISFNQMIQSMPKEQSDIALSKLSEIKSSIQISIQKQRLNFSKRQIQIEGDTLFYDKNKKFKKYQGDHKEGVMHGAGTLYFQDGITVQYEGDFQNDLFHGFGTLNNANPVAVSDLDVKDLRDIQIHGWWTSYDGSFMKGKKTGEGRFSLTDGSTYFGLFEQDQIHGVGYLTCPNKQDLYARWENGILKEIITGSI